MRVESVNSEITCKSDRVENLDKCLERLKSVGVDTAGIDAEGKKNCTFMKFIIFIFENDINTVCFFSLKWILKCMFHF